MSELRIAFRQLMKDPGFTAVAMLTHSRSASARTHLCSASAMRFCCAPCLILSRLDW